ncbi:MAG: DinB family protein [Chloroflexota bacterium]|nr:DinB family protein [Chloroflexota bacterium]
MSAVTIAPVTEADRSGLLRRVRAAHRLFELGVADLTKDQVDHFERKGVLPIAFSLAHMVISEDRGMTRLFGVPLLWDAHAGKVRLDGGVPFQGSPMSQAEKVRIGDVDAWRAYQRDVFTRSEQLIAGASLEKLGDIYPNKPSGTSFLALLVEDAPARVVDACEAWVFQHAIRHVGELEHARALVGLGGLS